MQLFYILIFLNLFQPILSTNRNLLRKIILDKMDELSEEILKKLIIFHSKFDENLRKEMGEKIGNAMFTNKFPSKIEKVRMEMEKYLSGEGERTFTEILIELNSLKLKGEKLNELKELQKHLNEKMKEHKKNKNFVNFILYPFEYPFEHPFDSHANSLELINSLINTHEMVDKYVEGIIMNLRIRQPIKYFFAILSNQIDQQMAQFEVPYNDFVKKYSNAFFPIIKNYIVEEKGKLQKVYNEIVPQLQTSAMPQQLKIDLDTLWGALLNSELLEKVALNIEHSTSQHFVKILSENLYKAVDRLPKKIELLFANNIKKVG